MRSLLQEVTDEVEGIEPAPEPVTPKDGWSIGHLSHHGLILSCEGFTAKLGPEDLQKFFDIAEDGAPGEIHDQNGDLILVEPTEDSIVLTRTGDKVYPSGITLDMKTLNELGIEKGKAEEEPEEEVQEGVKKAFRRSGKKIKRGFRVTSGYRKGRVVASLKTAYKPRAKASTRMKLSIAGRKKKFIRLLKSRRTRKKSISKRLTRMNKR